MSHILPTSTVVQTDGPRFRTGDHIRAATNVNRHGFYVSGTVAQLGSVHEGVLEFPNLGALPVQIRVRATDAQYTHCHFYDLSLKDQSALVALIERYEGGADDAINDLSYDEIARGDGSESHAQPQIFTLKSSNGNGSNGNGSNGNGSNGNGSNGNGSNGNAIDETQDLQPKPSTASASRPSQQAVAEPSKPSAQPAVKKSTGLIAMAVLLVGIVAIATLVYLFFRSQSSIPVQNAVLLGNYVPIKSNVGGVIENVFVSEGDVVMEGDPLFRVVDQQVELLHAETKAAMVAATMERDSAVKGVENAKMQFKVVASTLKGDIDVAKAALNYARIDLKRNNSLVNRLKPLADPDRRVILQAKYDEAVMVRDAAQANYAMREAELNRLEERGKMLQDSNVLMVGDRVDHSMALAESKLASAEAALAEMNARIGHLEAQRKGFTVTAPQAGTVYASYLKQDSFVKVGGEVLAIGTREESWAVGHVTQKMAMKVLPGQKVRVKLPALGITDVGEVASVGHRGIYSQNGWNPDFRADPTLVPIKVTLPDMPYKIPAGLRIGMVVELEYEWPWNRKEPQLEEETSSATATIEPAS